MIKFSFCAQPQQLPANLDLLYIYDYMAERVHVLLECVYGTLELRSRAISQGPDSESESESELQSNYQSS